MGTDNTRESWPLILPYVSLPRCQSEPPSGARPQTQSGAGFPPVSDGRKTPQTDPPPWSSPTQRRRHWPVAQAEHLRASSRSSFLGPPRPPCVQILSAPPPECGPNPTASVHPSRHCPGTGRCPLPPVPASSLAPPRSPPPKDPVRTRALPHRRWWGWDTGQQLRKPVWRSFKTLHAELPYDSAREPREQKSWCSYKNLGGIHDSQKVEMPQGPSSDEWTIKTGHIHATEYYAVLKRNANPTPATTQTVLENIERGQTQRPGTT